MQTEQNSLERRIELSVATTELEAEVEKKLLQMARQVKMPGFRKGKVPLKMVAQNYGQEARSEALGGLVERQFEKQVREQSLRIAGTPQIKPLAEENGQLRFEANFEVYPEVKLGDLSATIIEKSEFTVTDKEVDETINVLREQRTHYHPVERAAQQKDRVNIDFVGRLDGVEFDGGKGADFPFVIGAGTMLNDFETAVEGLTAGATKSFKMTFPADYHAEHLKDKEVEFTVTLNKVEEPQLPEVNEAFARTLGVSDGSVEKMRSEVRDNLVREVSRRLQQRTKDAAMNALIEVTPLAVPQALVEQEARVLAQNAVNDMRERGMDTKNMPIEPTWFKPQAERRVRLGLIIGTVVNENNLQSQPEQVRLLVADLAKSYERPEEIVRWYYAQSDRLAQAQALVVESNVVDWVLSKGKVTLKKIDFKELMGSNQG